VVGLSPPRLKAAATAVNLTVEDTGARRAGCPEPEPSGPRPRTSHGHRERAAGGAVRASDWDREPLFPVAKKGMKCLATLPGVFHDHAEKLPAAVGV
jgi:hypothetical protein